VTPSQIQGGFGIGRRANDGDFGPLQSRQKRRSDAGVAASDQHSHRTSAT
jgi:hypothetical protein